MQTRWITAVSLRFNPFTIRPAKTCRSFLSHFGPGAWAKVKMDTTLLPKSSTDPSFLKVTFQDGKELALDTETLSFKDIAEEINRHSRLLTRKADLAT